MVMRMDEFRKMLSEHQVECPVVTKANKGIESLCRTIRSLQLEIDHLQNAQSPSEQQTTLATNLARYLLTLYNKGEIRALLGSQLRLISNEILRLSPEEREEADSE